MSHIIDISPPLSPDTAVWPGDTSLRREVALDLSAGDNLTLSNFTTTTHIGAHTDAPSHYAADGQTIEQRPLEPYIGPCQVITVDIPAGTRVKASDIKTPITAQRVLIKTSSCPDYRIFNEDFCALDPSLIEALVQQGVILIGIDTPSVDLFDDKVLLTHNAIYKADLSILEGVVLGEVEDGEYILVAPPLPIVGADASPVRALLLTSRAYPYLASL